MSYSGASFTVTLYTAVGNAGKRVTLIHNGTTATQIYTLATTGGQTVGGIASGSYKLCTSGETLTLESNGTNWIVADHKTLSAWASAGTITIQATTTNPTKGSVQSVDNILWRRSGDSAHFRMYFRQTNATGSAAGSGDYLFKIPSSVGTIDTAKVTVYATVEGWSSYAANAFGVGSTYAGTGANTGQGVAVVYDSAAVRIFQTDASGPVGVIGSGGFSLTATDAFYSLDFIVPMTDWQP